MEKVTNKTTIEIPADGLDGLKQYGFTDAISGILVFLLALPLSLGIAKASEFPPIMGLITAMIGGIVVSFFAGSRLTIKGPAAGLIVIVAECVADYGGGERGWHLALGAIVVAGVVQILFGIFKLGRLSDLFPLSAVHGMLAAIGIIIISKQVHVLLDIDPALTKGKSPFALLGMIPQSLLHLDPKATFVGVVSLVIMLGMPLIKHPVIRKIPAPLLVLLFAIPAELFLDFQHTEPAYALVHIGNLLDNVKVNVDFGGIAEAGTFIKFVVMFALVGSLESLLTVKAIDGLDPYRRKSNSNKDLIAVGIGNTLAGVLGGLPMISEVARSSANVANGAKTRWANFFHGVAMLVFVLLAVHLIELIPNTALAAMLITVGIRLAHPKEFIHAFRIGPEQLLIFCVTIVFTLGIDLLVGIAAGMVTEIIINLINGKPLRATFKAPVRVYTLQGDFVVEVSSAAVFTNWLGIKKELDAIPSGSDVTIDLSKTRLVDHSVMENLHLFERSYNEAGGHCHLTGLERHKALSGHQFSARKLSVTA